MSRYHTSASGASAGQLVACRAKVFCRNGGAHHDAALVKEISKETFTPIQNLTESDIKIYQDTHGFYDSKKARNNHDDSKDFVVEKAGAGSVKVWRNKDGVIDRGNDKPAMIYQDGTQKWFKDGELGRDDDQPAVVTAYGTKEWYKNGKLGRDDDQPAVVYPDGTQEWYQEGRLYRDNDQPSVIASDGSKSWYKDGRFARDDDKPTMVRASGVQIWHKPGSRTGIIHRDGGKPAVVAPNGKEKYFINGKEVPARKKS